MRLAATLIATSLSLAGALAACGEGNGNDRRDAGVPDASTVDGPALDGPAHTPRLVIAIATTTEVPGRYGDVGAYEQLTGTITGELDPGDPHNAIIQDLALAPVNEHGMVEFASEFVLLKPKDMSKASGVLRYDAPNRGNILTAINPTTTPSDAVYLERGYAILYAAWQGDVPKSSPARLTATVPIAHNPDGSSITGPYRAELVPASATPDLALPAGVFNGSMIPYEPASLDNTLPGYALTRRRNETDPHVVLAPRDWAFARCDSVPFPGTAAPDRVCLRGGFDPSFLYELVYVAKDPKVMGVGLAGLRDMVAFFRNNAVDSDGHVNPLAGHVTHAIAEGTSQCGNAMKTFLHLGFNQALDGARVFDGIYAHVAARQTNINTRFAVPGGGGGLRTDHTAFGQTAPRGLAADYVDELRGRTGGVLKRCTETATCPKLFLGLSGTEFWQLQGSPVLTDVFGFADLPQPDHARIYYYASTQHGGAGGTASIAFQPGNVYPTGTAAHHNDTFRALFLDLEDWVVNDTEPPPSQVPHVADGTLVRPDEQVYPAMRGTTWPVGGAPTPIPDFQYLARYNDWQLLDFGPGYAAQDESGIASVLPPIYLNRDYAILVPKVDPRTGLALAGIHGVEVQAPLGTSLEFNYVNRPGIVDLANLSGAFIPFHKTTAARDAAGDGRPSLEELYGTQAGYVAAVTAAAGDLVARRLLLQRDADRLIAQARATIILP